MEIIFDSVSHTYTSAMTGQILPSVNQIISFVYGSGVEFVRPDILQSAAERGTAIHKEIEMLITGKIEDVKHWETVAFSEWAQDNKLNLTKAKVEQIVCVPGMFAGTADLVCDGLFDYKTSKNKPTKEMLKHWQKQLSFYYYALKNAGEEPKKMTVLHLSGSDCTPYELDYLGDEFVEETVKMFQEGRKEEDPKAQTELQTVTQTQLRIFAENIRKISAIEKEVDAVREQIKDEMEKRGIMALEVGDVLISYVGPSKRKAFDSKRFKAENEDLYKKYLKESEVNGQIRIRVK